MKSGLLLFCAGLLLTLVSCGKKAQAPQAQAVPVLAARAVQKIVPIEIQSIGNVQAYSTVSVKSLVDGQLVAIHFKEGDFVRKGDLLFSIDPRPFEVALAKSRAASQRDSAAVIQAQADLSRDIAQNANAQAEAVRYAELVQKNYASKEQADQYAANAAAAAATVRADKAAIQTAEETVQADKNDIRNAALEFEYCSIRSPLDGRTGAYQNHVGDIIKANDTSGLTTVNQINPIFVSFTVPEQYLDEIRSRQSMEPLAAAAAVPQSTIVENGSVSFINNTVDPATGTIQLKAVFRNADRKLWPGQFVNVTLRLRKENAVTIPTQALETGQNGMYVFVIHPDDTVEMRSVTTAESVNNGDSTIIKSGIKPDETVVTDGQLSLVNGSKVMIKR